MQETPSSPWCALGLSMPASFRTPTSRKSRTASSESNGQRPGGWRTSVTKFLKDLQWDSLQERRRQQRLVFMYKMNEQVAVPANTIDLTYSSRPVRRDKNKKKLFKPRTNTTWLQKSFVHITIPDWNSLPHSVAQSGTVDSFKCRLAVLPWGADPSLS